jgi:hypothetical protein
LPLALDAVLNGVVTWKREYSVKPPHLARAEVLISQTFVTGSRPLDVVIDTIVKAANLEK